MEAPELHRNGKFGAHRLKKDNKLDNNSTSKPSATDSEDNWVSTIEIPSGWFDMSIEHELRL